MEIYTEAVNNEKVWSREDFQKIAEKNRRLKEL